MLKNEYAEDGATAIFCEYFEKFFDCFNVRSLHEDRNTQKPVFTTIQVIRWSQVPSSLLSKLLGICSVSERNSFCRWTPIRIYKTTTKPLLRGWLLASSSTFPTEDEHKGNAYYTFQLQTDAGKCIKGACFSPQKEKELRKFSESKSATSLSGIVRREKWWDLGERYYTGDFCIIFRSCVSIQGNGIPCTCPEEMCSIWSTTEMISVTGDFFYF